MALESAWQWSSPMRLSATDPREKGSHRLQGAGGATPQPPELPAHCEGPTRRSSLTCHSRPAACRWLRWGSLTPRPGGGGTWTSPSQCAGGRECWRGQCPLSPVRREGPAQCPTQARFLNQLLPRTPQVGPVMAGARLPSPPAGPAEAQLSPGLQPLKPRS